jgi:hypothetical protein
MDRNATSNGRPSVTLLQRTVGAAGLRSLTLTGAVHLSLIGGS